MASFGNLKIEVNLRMTKRDAVNSVFKFGLKRQKLRLSFSTNSPGKTTEEQKMMKEENIQEEVENEESQVKSDVV